MAHYGPAIPCKLCGNYPISLSDWAINSDFRIDGDYVGYSLRCLTCDDGVFIGLDKADFFKKEFSISRIEMYFLLIKAWNHKQGKENGN